jgi:hypothetical protein
MRAFFTPQRTPMATRNRHGSSTRGSNPRGKADARASPRKTTQEHVHQKQATTPDPVRQQQALANQGSQGRMASTWRTRFGEDDEDEDETPPTLH